MRCRLISHSCDECSGLRCNDHDVFVDDCFIARYLIPILGILVSGICVDTHIAQRHCITHTHTYTQH